MKKPIVSVVITTYKRDAKFLKRAITSVQNQTFTDFEIIVVDDNGKNSHYGEIVGNVCRDISGKIKLIKHDENWGAQVARNTGIKNAMGKYIAFLDDDDEWLEQKLDLQLKKFEVNKQDLGLVYCSFNIIEQKDDRTFETKVRKSGKNKTRSIKYLLRENFIGSTSFPLIKKECFEKVGFFDETLKAKQDYDMWIRIRKSYIVDYVSQPLCNYYAHSNDRISNNVNKKLEAEKMFLEKHFDEIKKDKIALAIKYKLIGKYYLRLNELGNSKRYFLKSLLTNPFNYKIYLLLILTLFDKK